MENLTTQEQNTIKELIEWLTTGLFYLSFKRTHKEDYLSEISMTGIIKLLDTPDFNPLTAPDYRPALLAHYKFTEKMNLFKTKILQLAEQQLNELIPEEAPPVSKHN